MVEDSPDESMSTKEAIEFAAEHFGVPSMYAMAKALSDETLKVQTIQISNYRKGTKMSKEIAQRFYDTYGIIVNDYSDRGTWQNKKGLDL